MKQRFIEAGSQQKIAMFLCWMVIVSGAFFQMVPCTMAAEATKVFQPIDLYSEKLLQGLDVRIIEKFFRTVNEMPDDASFSRARPIRKLAYRYEGGAPMFDTDRSLAIGLSIRGYIHIEKPGVYEFQAQSNDGIRVTLADQVILEDPDVHQNRFSAIARCDIPKAGYLPIHVLYFQRKGSSCLELYWKRPGSNQFEIIPESAFWRGKES